MTLVKDMFRGSYFVLHNLGTKSLVERALDSCQSSKPDRQFVIIGYKGEEVKNALSHLSSVEFVEQKEQLGTGHAIQQVMPNLEGFEGDILVLNGDVPLLRPETVEKLVTTHQESGKSALKGHCFKSLGRNEEN